MWHPQIQPMFSLFLLGVTPPATEVGRNSSATAHGSAGSCRDYFSATCHYLNQELLQNTQILNPASVKNAVGCFPPTAMTSFEGAEMSQMPLLKCQMK